MVMACWWCRFPQFHPISICFQEARFTAPPVWLLLRLEPTLPGQRHLVDGFDRRLRPSQKTFTGASRGALERGALEHGPYII